MKFFSVAKDGGPESPVIGYFLVEIKPLFSIVLLHFTGTREAFHSHAFNAVTLWLRGSVVEEFPEDEDYDYWTAGDVKYTRRESIHRVLPLTQAWALSFRGPWINTWKEYLPKLRQSVTLTHGRKVVQRSTQWNISTN